MTLIMVRLACSDLANSIAAFNALPASGDSSNATVIFLNISVLVFDFQTRSMRYPHKIHMTTTVTLANLGP
jgi:hypothetical protein